MRFRLNDERGLREIDFTPRELVIAGWTGRDLVALERHIAELQAIGVKRPAKMPCFYRLSPDRLTTDTTMKVVGMQTSGEAEFVLVALDDGLYVGAGSDHTDRKVEAYNITVSKQICQKVMAPELWRYDEVAPHWDELVLRAYSTRGGRRRLYQEDNVRAIKSPEDLMRRYSDGSLPPGTVMFGGTVGVHDDMEYGERFEFELVDERRGRRLAHAYVVDTLPNIG